MATALSVICFNIVPFDGDDLFLVFFGWVREGKANQRELGMGGRFLLIFAMEGLGNCNRVDEDEPISLNHLKFLLGMIKRSISKICAYQDSGFPTTHTQKYALIKIRDFQPPTREIHVVPPSPSEKSRYADV
jgi:hypothetical protein